MTALMPLDEIDMIEQSIMAFDLVPHAYISGLADAARAAHAYRDRVASCIRTVSITEEERDILAARVAELEAKFQTARKITIYEALAAGRRDWDGDMAAAERSILNSIRALLEDKT